MEFKREALARTWLLAACLAASCTAAQAACDTPEPKPSAEGWEIELIDDTWIARSAAYPGLDVPLFMASPSRPKIYEFVTLPRYENRIALLQYYAGDPGTSYLVTLVYNAILDLEENRVIGEAPFTEDCAPAEWIWSDTQIEAHSDYGTDVFDLQ